MDSLRSLPAHPPIRSSKEREKGLRRLRVIACGIEIDIPAEGETSVRALMRAVVSLAFPDRRSHGTHCCLFHGDRALPESTRVAELPPNAVLHLHFVADGLGTGITRSEERDAVPYTHTVPGANRGILRHSASPVMLSPLDTIQLQQRGGSYDGPRMPNRISSGPSSTSPMPNPLRRYGQWQQRNIGLTASATMMGSSTDAGTGSRATLPLPMGSYPRLRREYQTTSPARDQLTTDGSRISITVMLLKRNTTEDKDNAKGDDQQATSVTSLECGSGGASSSDGTVAYRRLRVESDYPVGTLREFFGITSDYCIYLGETAIKDDRAPFGSLQGVSTQTFSFRPYPTARAGLSLATTSVNVAHTNAGKAKSKVGEGKDKTTKSVNSNLLSSSSPSGVGKTKSELDETKEKEKEKVEVEVAAEKEKEKETRSETVEYMKLNAVPVTDVNSIGDSDGGGGGGGGVSSEGQQKKHKKCVTAEGPESVGKAGNCECSSNDGNASTVGDPLETTMPFESPSKATRSRLAAEALLSQTHPGPFLGSGDALSKARSLVRAELMGEPPLHEFGSLSFGAGLGRRFGGGRVEAGGVRLALRPHSLAPLETSGDVRGWREEGQTQHHYGTVTITPPTPTERGTVVVPVPPLRPVDVLVDDTNVKGHHTLAPLSGVSHPVSILSSGLMQRHRRNVVGSGPVIVEEKQQNNTVSQQTPPSVDPTKEKN
ncbi:hypothetical protein, conserved [Trypanosoma brucei brucei TREU927]|uniref:Uncharacterized protein n=1 Tax=Trypanosoma brucei brucei (strain 927/4 GUTat10.1) TaxID=185431 RepID=Q4GYV1_TRYB2|nr:hypothetical protein, conserved [Trypanosoma brucei brucei TREU927]CAJ16423.1 hypothetical protein, conserved [Trypanosoma brucei brucei TREU927]